MRGWIPARAATTPRTTSSALAQGGATEIGVESVKPAMASSINAASSAVRAAVERIFTWAEDLVEHDRPIEVLTVDNYADGPALYLRELDRDPTIAERIRELLLDEPVAGMNLEETEDMARFILDVQSELGIAVILVEHDMGLVMDVAQRVLAVDFGSPIAIGTPAEIQANPDVIAAYLGAEHQVATAVEND